jgi:asparagine synthase (glutamine-hydrolysing)
VFLFTEYSGCAGAIDLPARPPFPFQIRPLVRNTQPPEAARPPSLLNRGVQQLIQWRSCAQGESHTGRDEVFLLAGAVVSPWSSREDGLTSLLNVLRQGQLDRLWLEGDWTGAYVSAGRAVLMKTRTSTETIFYRRDGPRLCWSTDPRDLLSSHPTFEREALAACCRGEDAFVYQGLSWVPAGYAVSFTPDRVDTFPLAPDPYSLAASPPCRRLTDWAHLAYTSVLEATRHLAVCGQPVGLLLSGGIDSAALAAALVENGGKVIGYHFWHEHPAANEAAFAQEVCHHLHIPLRLVRATTDADYLERGWSCVHPYGHPGYRWFEQAAQMLDGDGVRLLVSGRYGDAAFGPAERYGLADILAGSVALREKGRMAVQLLSTSWTLPDLLRSVSPGHSLIDTTTLSRAERRTLTPRRADFVVQPGGASTPAWLRYSDFASESSLDFSPQDLAVEQIWRRYGIRIFHPYNAAPVRTLSARLPAIYCLLPFQGQKVTKPVLRLAFAHRLPPSVLRRLRGGWPSVPGQQFCLEHAPWLESWLACEEATVIRMGLIDRDRLRYTLRNPRTLRANYHSILATAMVEIFLHQFQPTERLSWL